METKTAYDPRDITVHLRDAALYILLRWRVLLATALVGAILLTVGQYIRDLRRYRMGQTAPQPITTLSADARARVAAAMGYQAAYRRVCTYNEKAPLMQVDPGATPTRRMRLLITGEGCWSAACLYQEYVAAESLYRDLAEDAAQEPYLAELVTVAVETEPTQSTPQRAFLTVQVLAPTEELCNRLSSVVRRRAEEVSSAVTEAVGEHRAVWVFDRYAVLSTETVAEHQQTSLERQSTLQQQYAAAQSALSSEEKEYVLRLMGQSSAAEPLQPPGVDRRAWLWGFLLGGGIGFAWLSVRYLLCGRVLSSADAVSRHGVTVAGVLGEAGGGLTRRLRDAAEEPELVWQRLAVSAVAAGVRRLYLSVSAEEPFTWDGLAAALERQGVALTVGESPCADGEAARAFSACDGLVCAVSWGYTTHRAVARELALAHQWKTAVLGLLLLQ